MTAYIKNTPVCPAQSMTTNGRSFVILKRTDARWILNYEKYVSIHTGSKVLPMKQDWIDLDESDLSNIF